MWLVIRETDGTGGTRISLPAPLRAALIRWYCGVGTAADEAAGIVLVQQARIGQKWIACDCLGERVAPPVLTPAFLSDAETYYLRRLTGQDRPDHHADCPFFRDQATARLYDSLDTRIPALRPDGYFQVLRPSPEKLAQRPVADQVDDRTRHPSLPILARLMRQLLLVSGRTRAELGNRSGSIKHEFAAIRAAAERVEVAPGVALGRVLWTHANALASRRLFAALRAGADHWPDGHAPQGFLLLFCREFHGHYVHPADGAAIRVANRVQSPATYWRDISPPYLTLIVVGQYPEARGLAPLRAYAQPILSGRCFMPIDDMTERAVVRELLVARRLLAAHRITLTLEKPVFDRVTPFGEHRPSLLLEAHQSSTGAHHVFVIEVDVHSPLQRSAAGSFGTLLDPERLAAPAIVEQIVACLGGDAPKQPSPMVAADRSRGGSDQIAG